MSPPRRPALPLRLIDRARERRGFHLFAAQLRIFIGFALLPSGLKKVLGEPFTDPGLSGPFHDFLDAFLGTGFFYSWVGVMQLVASILLLTQRLALVGALMALPIFSVILVFCWSTAVYPTASVVTLIFLGVLGLVLWDYRRWWRIFATDESDNALGSESPNMTNPSFPAPSKPADAPRPLIDVALWSRCGLAIIAVYALACALEGGIYRPRRLEFHEPSFWVFPLLLTLPIGTALIERRRRTRASSTSPARRAP
jgi:uncharacterized membrane protein YphA (DoxX/SURF4 family)